MTVQPRAEYRLHWMTTPTDDAASALGLVEPAGAWIGSDDPSAIRKYVLAQDWPTSTALTLTISDPTAPLVPLSWVTCGVDGIRRWSPAKSPLPAPDPELSQPRSRRTARSAFMRDLRRAVAAAVEADLLDRDQGDGLLLLADDAIENRRPPRQTSGRADSGNPDR